MSPFLARLLPDRAPVEGGTIFDPRLFSRFDRMRLRARRASGARAGETRVRGATQVSGIEIESFKSYTPGDDIRHLDWNAVGRLDQLLTRRFVAEREIPIHVLLDVSASMGAPQSDGKFEFSRRLVAALAYVALNTNDPIRLAAISAADGGAGLVESPQLRHRGRLSRLEPFLAALAPAGGTALRAGVERYLERHHERGVVFLVSDFLCADEDSEGALQRLQARRMHVIAVHVVGREESTLEGVQGRLRLRDVESGSMREVSLAERDRRRYREAFLARAGHLRGFCHRRRAGYARVLAGDGVERALTGPLATTGVLLLR
jgi:uncharacterized protein (DUF58 family)